MAVKKAAKKAAKAVKAAQKKPSSVLAKQDTKHKSMSKEKEYKSSESEDLAAEQDVAVAEDRGPEDIGPRQSLVRAQAAGPVQLAATPPPLSPYDLAGYVPPLFGDLTTNPLSAQTLATIAAFKVGLVYYVARRVGVKNNAAAPATDPPIWEYMYELVPRVVRESTINQDLLDFQQAIYKGNAYNPGVGTAVSGVTVVPSALATLAVGTSSQLTATVAPAGATVKGVTWSSADATIAFVSDTGLVTGVKTGGPINVTAKAIGDPTKLANVAVTVV